MATLTWETPTSLSDALTTELNSLADASNSSASGAIDNTTNKDMWMLLELYLGSVDLSAKINPSIEIYMIVSADGTNYEDADETGTFLCAIPVKATNAAHRKVCGPIQIPPHKFKLMARNKTGAALASSGNTLKQACFGMTSA